MHYFGTWDDPEGARREFEAFTKTQLPADVDSYTSDTYTRSTPGCKPAKPYPEFPLFAHGAGYWAKKIRGKTHYFGPWSDPDGAIEQYNAQKEDLHAGRKPREHTPDGLTVKRLCNEFLNSKKADVQAGNLSPRTLQSYSDACKEAGRAFGPSRLAADIEQDDFTKLRRQIERKWGPHRVATTIQCVRCLCRWGFEKGLLQTPLRFGPDFKRPSAKTMRLHRAAQGPKLFSAEETRELIETAGVPMKAMVLLAINCGFGNSDCGRLPRSAINLETAWLDFPRPKTGIARRCWLWPETVDAIRDAVAKRPTPKDAGDARLVFVTKYGGSWASDTDPGVIAKETRKLLDAAGIDGRRGFYALRHTFRTIADGAKDQPAADYIMGHEAPHMSSHYRETIADDRLRAVAEHVRGWLWPKGHAKQRRLRIAN
jgi:integrase